MVRVVPGSFARHDHAGGGLSPGARTVKGSLEAVRLLAELWRALPEQGFHSRKQHPPAEDRRLQSRQRGLSPAARLSARPVSAPPSDGARQATITYDSQEDRKRTR